MEQVRREYQKEIVLGNLEQGIPEETASIILKLYFQNEPVTWHTLSIIFSYILHSSQYIFGYQLRVSLSGNQINFLFTLVNLFNFEMFLVTLEHFKSPNSESWISWNPHLFLSGSISHYSFEILAYLFPGSSLDVSA